MATKTRTDLVNKALSILIPAAGQNPSAEDYQAMDSYVDPLVAELEQRQIVTVDDTSAIPAEWFLPLAILLANDASMEFGAPVTATPSNPDPVGNAIMRLREVQYSRPTGEPMRGEYF